MNHRKLKKFLFSNRKSKIGNRKSRGFTLLEVLVALLVIGISLGALFQAISGAKRISWKADEVSEVSRISHNLLVNSILMDEALREKEKEGEVFGEEGWRYRITVRPLGFKIEGEKDPLEPLPVPGMLMVDFCLFRESGGETKSFCLSRWYRK